MIKITKFFSKIKDLFTLTASTFVASAINSLFWLYLASSVLNKTEYGELGFLVSIATTASGFASLGVNGTIIVYEAKQEKVFSATYSLWLLSSMISSVIVYFITQNIFVSFLIFGFMIFQTWISLLSSKKKYITISKYMLTQRVLTVIFAIIFYEIFGLSGILLGFALALLMGLPSLLTYLKQPKQSIRILKPKIKFMLNFYLNGVLSTNFWWADKIIIGIIFGFSTLGVYYFAAQYVLLLYAIPRALFNYLLPQDSQGIANYKTKKYSILISCGLAVAAYFAAPYIVNTLFSEFTESIEPMQIMSLSVIPLTITSIYESRLFGREDGKIVNIGLLIQMTSYFIFIPILGNMFGVIGIAFGFLMAIIIRLIFYLLAIRY